MKTVTKRRLFWYLKDGTELDLENPSLRDMYVQQVLSHGSVEDVRKIFQLLSHEAFKDSLRIYYSPFRFEEPKDSEEFPGIKIDSLPDIAANKLLTLFGPATLRDFVDVYFLIKKFTKAELIQKASGKDPGFDLYWLGVAFERIKEFSADFPEMHLLIKPCNIKELQDFFN